MVMPARSPGRRRVIAVLLVLACSIGCERDPLMVEIQPNAILEVRHANGSPARNVWAGILGEHSFLVGYTDSTGRLVADLFDTSDGPAVVSAIRDTLVAAAPVTVGSESRFFVLTLGRGGTLRGHVERSDDSTHQNIDVRLDQTVIRTLTNESGDFALAVPAGTWTVKITDQGHTGWLLTRSMPAAGDTLELPPIVIVPTSASSRMFRSRPRDAGGGVPSARSSRSWL
jgi:hypothetical protein